MKHVVGIDANDDSATGAVARHRKKNVYPYLRARGFTVDLYTGKKAQRALVAAAVSVRGVDYVTGVGHGAFDRYLGYQGLPIFQVGGYAPAEARTKVVHLLSCLTANGLGPDFVANGARAFFGYDTDFNFNTRTRDGCLECDSEIDRGFADGLTAHEVYQRTIAAFTRAANEARRRAKPHMAARIENNRDHLCAPTVDPRFGQRGVRVVRKSKKR